MTNRTAEENQAPRLDLSDVVHRVGEPCGGGQLWDPCTATDYLAYWAGHDGMVRHSKMTFRSPSFEGDVTYVDGEISGKQPDSAWGVPLISIKVQMTNQEGAVVVDGTAEVEVPL